MKLSHTTPAQTRRVHRGRPARGFRREQGYSLIMTALLLVPMLGFSALGVDVAAWYARALEVQRAADAAAMAAVVWMPGDFDQAQSEAQRVAARNGFAHDPSGTGVTVTAERVSGRPQEIDVTVTDPHVGTYFGQMFVEEISITREARARYVLPVPLGSPHNTFGNQNLTPGSTDPKLWAAINAPYTLHQSGDPYATKCGGDTSSLTSCPSQNEDYRSEGYRYVVDIPASAVGKTLEVEVFDAPFVARSSTQTETGDGHSTNAGSPNTRRMPMQFELFASDATPLDILDNPSMTTTGRCTAGGGRIRLGNNHGSTAAAPQNGWGMVCRASIANLEQTGQYVLQVKSSDIPGSADQGGATNQYSLRATLSSNPQPRLYAYGDMSILTNPVVPSGGTRTNNYLAEVVPHHAGKTLRIELFDAGDGNNGQFDLSILAPDGSVPQCRYNDPTSVEVSPALRTCTIRTRNNGTSTANNLYNNRWLTIEIPLSSTYSCTQTGATPLNPGPGTSSACWWRLSYLFGGTSPTPTDRTTWQAAVLGDPVQLIR